MGRDERASVVPLLALCVLLAGVAILVLGRIGAAAADRARAGVAADAAALAGAVGREPSARELAEANGGSLLRYERQGLDVWVTVRVGRATAVSRARATGPGDAGPGGGGPAQAPRLAPAMRAALSRAASLVGHQVVVRAVLERGLVVEVDRRETEALAAAGRRAGLCPDRDEAHDRFQLCTPPPDGP